MDSVGSDAEPEAVLRIPVASTVLRARTSVPDLPPSTVRRADLEAVLDGAGSRRLTLVAAGPGWGKTTTVAAWARSRPDQRVAWLTLEPFDETPAAFWSDLLAALHASGAVPPDHPLAAITVPSRMSARLLHRILRAVEELPEPVVVVLDDAHHLARGDVAATVDDLLRYPSPLHVVAITRDGPLLRLERLRAQGVVEEIGAAQLGLDASAVAALGALHERSLDAEEIADLLTATGGWPIGVRLRIEGSPDATGRARARRSEAEFLLAEVLDRQDPVARRFLLRTSLASTVCVGLAAAMDPGAPAARLLPALADADGFVTAVDGRRTWFRYHPLLREMLQDVVRREDPDGAAAAHRAAARWLVRHDEPLRALEHAVASRDWALTGEIFVEGAAVHLAGPRREAVAALLRRVPMADLVPDVALHLAAGSLALVDGRLDAARHQAALARALLVGERGRIASAATVLVELVAASTASATGDVRGLATSARAALAAADAAPFSFPALDPYRGLAAAFRASGLAWCAVTAPDVALRPAPAAPGRAGITTPVGLRSAQDADAEARRLVDLGAAAARALLDVSRCRVTDGEARAHAALETARGRGWDVHVQSRAAHAALAWAQHLRGAGTGLDIALSHALAADVGGREPASEAAVRLLQARVAAARRHRNAARHALAAADHALGHVPSPPALADLWLRAATDVRLLGTQRPGPAGAPDPRRRPPRVAREGLGSPAVVAVCRARAHLAEGRTDTALRTVAEVADAAADEADDLARTEAALVEASALATVGSRRAGAAVDRALDAAGRELLVAPFLTVAVEELRPTLTALVSGRTDPLAWSLRAALPYLPTGPGPAPLVEPLTERELAVLTVLPTMESNAEIAEDFFVSVNTVKAHLKALYRKLGVGSRRDAVRRGRELGLIS